MQRGDSEPQMPAQLELLPWEEAGLLLLRSVSVMEEVLLRRLQERKLLEQDPCRKLMSQWVMAA